MEKSSVEDLNLIKEIKQDYSNMNLLLLEMETNMKSCEEKLKGKNVYLTNNLQELQYLYNKFTFLIHENIILCDEIILKTCHHKFTKDLIDIDPERSEIIYYCEFCGFTKNDN